MPENFHGLLQRQLKKHFKDFKSENFPPGFENFIKDINESYSYADDDRVILERSIEISSQELLQSNSEIRAIFNALPDILVRIRIEDGVILEYKDESLLKTLPESERIVGKKLSDLFESEIVEKLERGIKESSETKALFNVEYPRSINNQTYFYEARIQSFLTDQMIIVIRNITERKLAEEQLRFDALHDKLTSLSNRTLFLDRLNFLLERTKRHPDYLFAVLFIDIDRFKVVNDSLGHLSGDQLLITIADRLKRCLRTMDTVARLGGDEFTVILDDIQNIKEAIIVAQRIQSFLSTPINLEGQDIFVTASIGITINSISHQKPEDLLREADTAMYRAKTDGRARYEIFNKDMHIRAMNFFNLEAELRRALKENEFQLYYQPIIALAEKKIMRMEALIRWIHPKRGIVPPLEFIPFAEETGLILGIGEWVLKTACLQNKAWHDSGFKNVGVAVNFSALQFERQSFPQIIKKILKETKMDGLTIEIEITESTAMKDINYTIMILKELKSLGIRISIDDFGVGYSSLSCLKTFPIDSLKIDRSFIKDIPSNAHNTAITTAIIALAHNLGLQVCAEGIEFANQYTFLENFYCDEGQGYLFSKPLPVAEATKILSSFNY